MAFTDKDREKIKSFGLSDDTIDFVLSQNSQDKADAEAAGVDSKESADAELIEKEADEIVEEAEATEEVEEAAEEVEEATEESGSTELDATEVASAFVETMAVVTEIAKQVKELQATNVQLMAEIKELKRSDAEKIADIKEATPWASQQELMRKSVVNQEGARVDGRTSLGKSGPKEADSKPEPIVGIPMVDQFLRSDRA